MEITFNNNKYEIREEISLQHAIDLWFGDKQKGIAVAVNEAIVPRSQWDTHTLQANDKVLVIRATQGG